MICVDNIAFWWDLIVVLMKTNSLFNGWIRSFDVVDDEKESTVDGMNARMWVEEWVLVWQQEGVKRHNAIGSLDDEIQWKPCMSVVYTSWACRQIVVMKNRRHLCFAEMIKCLGNFKFYFIIYKLRSTSTLVWKLGIWRGCVLVISCYWLVLLLFNVMYGIPLGFSCCCFFLAFGI